METKADIRKEALKLRSSFGEKERKAAEKKIAKRLLESSFYKEAESIYCYVSFRNEVDTAGIIDIALL